MTVELEMRSFGMLPNSLPPGHGGACDAAIPKNSIWLQFGPFQFSASQRLLIRDGAPVSIGGRAFDLLVALIERAGQIVGTRQLLDLVWPDVVVEEANLRVCVAGLRKALGEQDGARRYVVNVAGRGYTFVSPVQRVISDNAQVEPASDLRPATTHGRQPPRLLVSRNETLDILARLLGSGRFARIGEESSAAPPLVSATVSAILQETCGLDAACFILSNPFAPIPDGAQPGSSLADGYAGPALRSYLVEHQLLIVIGRCRHLAGTMNSLFERLFRAPSVHFLTIAREAIRANAGILPLPASQGVDIAGATPMIEELRKIGIGAMTYGQWRSEFNAPNGEEVRRLKELEWENERLRQAISDLTLEKLIGRGLSDGSY